MNALFLLGRTMVEQFEKNGLDTGVRRETPHHVGDQ